MTSEWDLEDAATPQERERERRSVGAVYMDQEPIMSGSIRVLPNSHIARAGQRQHVRRNLLCIIMARTQQRCSLSLLAQRSPSPPAAAAA